MIRAMRLGSSLRMFALQRSRGLSLIELMVSIVIGFLVVGSAIAIFSSNRQTYAASESLGRIQENMRSGFELMARDIREAAGTPCTAHITSLRSALNSPASRWWTNDSSVLRIVGYTGAQAFPSGSFGAATGDRVAGTQAIQVLSTSNSRAEISSHDEASGLFVLNTTDHGMITGDIVLACDYAQASLVQLTSASSASATVSYSGGGVSPGNATTALRPDDGSYSSGSVLAKWHAVRWYVGNNANGGRSLYQSTIINSNPGGTLSVQNQEVLPGVQDINMQYLVAGNYLTADAVTNWNLVTAVRVNFVIQGEDRVGTDGNPIQRTITHTIALRMRNK